MEMSSNQPYMFRGIYEWILDNGASPYVLVNAEASNVSVPSQSIENGQIILNISPSAVTNFHMDNDVVSFSARFGGVPENIYLPMNAILALYAAENGQGMVFSPVELESELEKSNTELPQEQKPQSNKPPKPGKPILKLVE